MCRMLARDTGLKVGGSSGAVLGACARYLLAHPQAQTVVCVCPDRGDHYDTTIFNDSWLKEQRLSSSDELPLPVARITAA